MHWTITGVKPVTTSSCFKDFILKNSVHGISSVSWRNLWHCFISDLFHVILHKENFSMWVTRGSCVGHIHLDCSVSQWVNKCDPLSTLVRDIWRLAMLIASANLHGFSLANHRWFAIFPPPPCQTFPLYGNCYFDYDYDTGLRLKSLYTCSITYIYNNTQTK